jgi:hypothetical protein
MYEVYRRMPNDTDLSVFKKAGLAGLNFGFIEEPQHYHAPTDDPAHLNKSTLQQEGSNALALSQHFGNIDLSDLRGDDAVYFDLCGRALVWYPAQWALPFSVAAGIAYLAVTAKAGGLRVFLGAWILPLLVIFVGGTSLFVAPRRARGEWPFWLGAISTVIVCIWMQIWALRAESVRQGTRFFPNMNVTHLVPGSLFAWVVLAIGTAVWLPGVSYVFLWPLVFALIGFGTRRWRVSSWVALGILCVTALPALFLVGPLVRSFYVALGPSFLPVPMVLSTLLMGALSLQIAAVSSQLVKES